MPKRVPSSMRTRPSRLVVRLIKAGVMPERIAPGKPQENGRAPADRPQKAVAGR